MGTTGRVSGNGTGDRDRSGRRVGRRTFVGMAAGGGAALAELAGASPAAAAAVTEMYVSTIVMVTAEPEQP